MNHPLLTFALDWIDERTGFRHLMSEALDEPIPGGSSYAYTFGSALVFVFLLQLLTGMFLTMYYVPSAEDAHRTVEYISKEVTCGAFLRGIHHYSASAMVILVVCHILQIIMWGAYKKKRELVWLVGAGLLQFILAFSLTGYLLPWDMKAYFGTQVTVNIASEVPLIGDFIKRVIQGGPTLGTLTLSRFFMVHAFLLPALAIGGIGLHLFLFRKARPAGPFHLSEDQANARTETFFPGQLFKDAFVALVIFGVIAWLAWTAPAPLEPKANPGNTAYIARPEWYFLSLFQLLKYFQGGLAIVGSLVIPGALISVLTFLPFIDRSPERNPFKRPVLMSCTAAVLATIGILTFMAKSEDRATYAAEFAKQARDGQEFLKQPFKPKEIGGAPVAPATKKPIPEAFKTKCAMCHGDTGRGGPVGPNLAGIARTKEDIIGLIENPGAHNASKMPAVTGLSLEERTTLAGWIKELQ